MIGEFEVVYQSKRSGARVGKLHTAHGCIETPVFMPVGTQATVKGLTPQQLKELNVSIILANTYHLFLRPGVEVIQEYKGLHSFMNWDRPILTDSGGYQVFSLSNLNKIEDEGVAFQSHLSGDSHFFSPEKVVDLQLGYGSDIMMPLDVCSPKHRDYDGAALDLKRTHQWFDRTVRHWQNATTDSLLFGIVQGGMFESLRRESVDYLAALDVPGYAIGGVSVGESKEDVRRVTAYTAPLLPVEKPRYLMGVGLPDDLAFSVRQGVDMFDCVAPARLARHGQVFTAEGAISIKKAVYARDQAPLELDCDCYTCQHFSKGYLHHLYRAKELLSNTLLTIHNIRYLGRLLDNMKAMIYNDLA